MTGAFSSLLRKLGRDTGGSMVIETAIVAPVLVLLALGGFDTSHMVSRQNELQSGAEQGTAVALAANLGAQTNTDELATLLRNSLNLQGNQVIVTKIYRCETSTAYVSNSSACANYFNSSDTTAPVRYSTYVKIQLTDSYQPIWSHLGLGGAFNFHVTRTVQLS